MNIILIASIVIVTNTNCISFFFHSISYTYVCYSTCCSNCVQL